MLITKDELIGLNMKVVKANNKTLQGIQGKIVDETKQSLIIATASGVKRLLKNQIHFAVQCGSTWYVVDGALVAKRPHERLQ